MVRIVLIRPGATDYDQQGRIQGVLDVPLCDAGAHEASRISGELQSLGVEVIYTSVCERAVQTASAVAASLGIKVKRMENMRNLDHGLWQGMLIEDVKRKQPKVYRQWQEQPDSICPPDGEMLGQARERVRATMARLLKKHKSGVVALVVPEPLASLVREHLDLGDLGDLWRAGKEHGTWEIINFESRPVARSG
ncbi:MAG TPA: histidine phosphatase family protein [Pirellulales bacterium]|nr:histidine phosphatase family protein [Pirellulales bacterium]